jgi:hypothetical protein
MRDEPRIAASVPYGISFPLRGEMPVCLKIFPHSRPVLTCTMVVLLLVAGCTRVEDPWTEEFDRTAFPVSESWDVTFHVSETDLGAEKSRPRLRMDAGYLATFEADSTYTLLEGGRGGVTQVKATIFDKVSGDTSAVVNADKITYVDRDRRFEAIGNVVVNATGERTLWSERFLWYERTRSVRAPGFVRIVTPRERIEGYNLDADEDLDNYRLERVTGEAQIDDEDDLPPEDTPESSRPVEQEAAPDVVSPSEIDG